MFFDRLKQLCEERNISVYKACTDIGLNRSAVNKWKTGAKPNGSTISKFASYFGVTTDYLLDNGIEKAPTETGERKYEDSEIMFALSRGGEGEITDAMFEEVKSFAAYIAQREAAKKEKK